MSTIAVFSGKGGTGKTTLVACFAQLAGRAVAVDCDVDAANLRLLMPGDDTLREPFLSGRRATIDPSSCLGCGACAQHCRFGAIVPLGRRWAVDRLACEGCGVCGIVCPRPGTVQLYDKLAGHWMRRRSGGSVLLHAALAVAQDNSGKLVAKVREEAAKEAEREGIPLILVDGPPGIGCPVHAAMGSVDRLLAVTEPTPSGLHDLERLLGLAAHFSLPACTVVNKWDLAPALTERIEASCERWSVPIAGRIPFDPQVPRMLADGRLPLEAPAAPETIRAIEGTWRELSQGPCGIPEIRARAG
jgi:MinD superfamily P-loop ATPase